MAAPSSATGGEGLSLQTLIVASLASAGAAIIVSLFWRQGTIMAAAITPVLVALLREAFHRPAQAISSARPSLPTAPRRPGARGRAAAAAGGAATAATAAGARSDRHEATTARHTQALRDEAGAGEPPTRALKPETTTLADVADTAASHPAGGEPASAPTAGDPPTRPLSGDAGDAPTRAPGGDAETRALWDGPDAAATRPPSNGAEDARASTEATRALGGGDGATEATRPLSSGRPPEGADGGPYATAFPAGVSFRTLPGYFSRSFAHFASAERRLNAPR